MNEFENKAGLEMYVRMNIKHNPALENDVEAKFDFLNYYEMRRLEYVTVDNKLNVDKLVYSHFMNWLEYNPYLKKNQLCELAQLNSKINRKYYNNYFRSVFVQLLICNTYIYYKFCSKTNVIKLAINFNLISLAFFYALTLNSKRVDLLKTELASDYPWVKECLSRVYSVV